MEATDTVVTTDVLHAELARLGAELRAEMWRAQYTAVATMFGLMVAVAAVSLTIASRVP